MLRSTIAITLLPALTSIACSSTQSFYPYPADAGVTDGSTVTEDEEADGGSIAERDASTKKDAAEETEPVQGCKRPTTGAMVRVDTNPSGDLPEAEGGTIPDGHYVLRQAIVMSDGDWPDVASDLWVGGGRYEYQTKNSDGWSYHYGGTFKTKGTNVVMTVDCGGQENPLPWSYSFDGTDLTVQWTNINGFSWMYVLRKK